ncbi:MAG TPA: SGNH/GDSL hydrolase family protein [Pirellulales bacterium]|nr:SGNH/GDSL hydrolase family protein [Pirellulales bacterium]
MCRVFSLIVVLLLCPAGALDASGPSNASALPTSVELWIEGVPAGASHSVAAPRAACALLIDDLRMTQAVDAEGGKTVVLLGPGIHNGDFESGTVDCNSYLVERTSISDATPQLPAASGKKFAVMVADPKVQLHIPRLIKYLDMPDLKNGRCFVFSVKVRAKKEPGAMRFAAVSVLFKDKNQQFVAEYHGDQFAVNADGWVEARVAFDYDRGIIKKTPDAPTSMAKLAAMVEAERAKWPSYDITPRADDGRNLALSVAKWEGRAGIPGAPFRVWAVGASWTGALASMSYRLEYAIRQQFPNAPPIDFKSQTGNGCPWNYARGWISQFVLADQPDLILFYTHGDLDKLDLMLTDIRRHSTADIIVPSLHLMGPDDAEPARWVETFHAGHNFEISALRAVCKKHGVEFVENRRELAEYLTRIGKRPSALLRDVAHQNEEGLCRSWDNIVRHIAKPAQFNYDFASRERRLLVAPPAKTATESVVLSDGWSAVDGIVRTSKPGERIRVDFIGNRIDVLGRAANGGGTVRVLIDGQPADQASAFYSTYIMPHPKSFPWKIGGPGPGDVGLHAVELVKNVVAQSWKITLTSETGDYRLEGSETGLDGEGNSTKAFTSRSGQIHIDPELWRYNRQENKGVFTYGNRAGDQYTFNVYRSAVGQVSFAATKPLPLHQPLVENLPNGKHTLELVTQGSGDVAVESFYVFQPPEK